PHAAVVAGALVGIPAGGEDALGLVVAVPVRRGGDGAGVGAETDQRGLLAPAFADQLADVVFAAHPAHLGRAGIADMAVVRPDQRPGSGPAMLEQVIERLGHVAVAQVPAFRAAIVHDPVIALGRGDEAGVHRRPEHAAVLFQRALQQLAAFGDDLLLALGI